jgi:hypothetical protein
MDFASARAFFHGRSRQRGSTVFITTKLTPANDSRARWFTALHRPSHTQNFDRERSLERSAICIRLNAHGSASNLELLRLFIQITFCCAGEAWGATGRSAPPQKAANGF